MKIAVVLFNLGGPDSPEAVQPFLRNLFSDRAIINLPGIVRLPLARFLSSRRAVVARKIYEQIGGSSPILGQTEAWLLMRGMRTLFPEPKPKPCIRVKAGREVIA